MKIEIWSDVMCPFCFIGKHHFEKAMSKLPFSKSIEVEWKSYQLDPTLPETAPNMSEIEYLEKRKGMPKSQIAQMFQHITNMGAEAGIAFNFQKVVPVNSFKAHRLIHLAKNKGLQNEMEEALFQAHFCHGKDLGDDKVLTEIATPIGINAQDAETALTLKQFTNEINEDINEAQNLGISGVPFFVIDRKYGISGAQPVDTFVNTIKRAWEENQPKIEIIQPDGQDNNDAVCGPDGCSI